MFGNGGLECELRASAEYEILRQWSGKNKMQFFQKTVLRYLNLSQKLTS